MPRIDILERKDEILQWIEEHQSKAFIAKQLNCKPTTLNNYLDKMGISYEGNKGSKGKPHNNQYVSALEYIKKTSGISTHRLKLKLIKDGIKEAKCEICGLSEWQGKPIPLELHHKNGNHYDNTLENLEIVCPNCHAQQPGNSGASANKYAAVLELEDNAHLECATKRCVSSNLTSSTKYCIDCGKKISNNAIRCIDCENINRRQDKVTREELKELIRILPMVQIGKKFNVSDNAVRKWCKSFNLPYKVSEIKRFSDQEWEQV